MFLLTDNIVKFNYLCMHFRVHWDPKFLGAYAEGYGTCYSKGQVTCCFFLCTLRCSSCFGITLFRRPFMCQINKTWGKYCCSLGLLANRCYQARVVLWLFALQTSTVYRGEKKKSRKCCKSGHGGVKMHEASGARPNRDTGSLRIKKKYFNEQEWRRHQQFIFSI